MLNQPLCSLCKNASTYSTRYTAVVRRPHAGNLRMRYNANMAVLLVSIILQADIVGRIHPTLQQYRHLQSSNLNSCDVIISLYPERGAKSLRRGAPDCHIIRAYLLMMLLLHPQQAGCHRYCRCTSIIHTCIFFFCR